MGEMELSNGERVKTEREEGVWRELMQIHREGGIVKGRVLNAINGGYAVGIAGHVCFLPTRETKPYKGKSVPPTGELIPFKILNITESIKNVILTGPHSTRESGGDESQQRQRAWMLKKNTTNNAASNTTASTSGAGGGGGGGRDGSGGAGGGGGVVTFWRKQTAAPPPKPPPTEDSLEEEEEEESSATTPTPPREEKEADGRVPGEDGRPMWK